MYTTYLNVTMYLNYFHLYMQIFARVANFYMFDWPYLLVLVLRSIFLTFSEDKCIGSEVCV